MNAVPTPLIMAGHKAPPVPVRVVPERDKGASMTQYPFTGLDRLLKETSK